LNIGNLVILNITFAVSVHFVSPNRRELPLGISKFQNFILLFY